MPKNIRVRIRFFTILLDFGRRFGPQIKEKSALQPQGLAKRKTLQNTGRGSKNQGSGFQKTLKNCFQNASEGDSDKDRPRNSKNNDFRSSWRPFWLPKSFKIDSQSDAKRSSVCDAMQVARKSAQLIRPQSFASVSRIFQRIRSA